MKRPAICLLTDSLEPSGLGQQMLLLARHLRYRYALSVVCPATGSGVQVLEQSRALGLTTLPLTVRQSGCAWQQLSDWLRNEQIALVHVHAGVGWEGHEVITAARAAGVPAVVRTEHLPYLLTDFAQRGRYRGLLSQVDRLICVSDEAYASYCAAAIPAAQLVTVRNGIDPPQLPTDVASVRATLGLTPQARVVLTIGRFSVQKDHATLAAAIPAVLAQVADAHFLWAGSGPLEAEVRALVNDLGVADQVQFLGQRSDIPALLAVAELLVLPSRFEGLPLVVLEAMAAGLPVVATNVSGTAEAVVDGVTGRLVPVGAIQALAHGINEVLADENLASRWGAAGLQRATEVFSGARMADETAALYEQLLKRSAADATDTLLAETVTTIRGTDATTAVETGRAARIWEQTKECKVKQVRVGFIGAGGIAGRHLGNLLDFADVQVVALADPDLVRAQASAGRCGAKAYTDYTVMLDNEQLDALYICVPPFAHGAPELAALERKLPFFVEKPLSVDLPVAEEIASSVVEQGLTTGVGYHWRYLDTVAEVKEHLAASPARLALGYWLDSTPPPAWWGRQDQSGGQMVEQTTHIFDVARYLLGPVIDIDALGAQHQRAEYPNLDVDDVSVALVRFASGAIGSFASTCVLKWPHRIGLHLFGDGLAIELSEFDLMVDVGRGRPVREAVGDPFVREDRDFIDAVRGGENKIRTPYAEALETHRLVIAARDAAERRAAKA